MATSGIDLVVHATHEAGFKVGGIGAVLDGLLSTEAYNRAVGRTILVGPMNTSDPTEMARLLDPSSRLQIIYSSWHQVDQASAEVSAGLREIEDWSRSSLLYGQRSFTGSESVAGPGSQHEVLLVDANRADLNVINSFKLELWRDYRIESDRYEWNEEFDQTIKAAKPAFAALNLVAGELVGSRYLLAHDWMGIPLALCGQIEDGNSWRLIFYAHEVPTARILVEDHPGHDTRFYNVLRLASAAGMTMDQLFGDRSDFFKHVLVKQGARLHNTFAVGEWVERELRFLGGDYAWANIDLVYNGVPSWDAGLQERTVSNRRLKQYCQSLLGYEPDYVFTHVTRMIISKGLWRDLSVLEHLDRMLLADGKKAVLFLLSTSEPAGRAVADILRWESEYGWPVVHRADNGDLLGHELPLYQGIERHNARARAAKVILVNQFGWSRERCDTKMPADMRFRDIRWGTDLEFGQSVYEPFGISQIESLGAGAVSVVSSVCGCTGFVRRAAREAGLSRFSNLLQADYTTLPPELPMNGPWDAMGIGHEVRDQLERVTSYNVARAVLSTLPATQNQARAMLRRGRRVARQMSWQNVAEDYLLPALRRVG